MVTDYGAFRDLQRHRLLTIEWQPLGTALGYDVPEIVVEAGEERRLRRVARALARAVRGPGRPDFPAQAAYAVALAFRIRYVMQMNAREAMHLIELRSGPQGHPAYRRVAQEMHRAIDREAGHRAIAAAMTHVDHGVDRPRAARGRATGRGPPKRSRNARKIRQRPDQGQPTILPGQSGSAVP